MRALVLEGGAMRGIFTAGVLDALAAKNTPPFDLVVDVSAGACCAVSYLAGQHGRNRRIFLDYMATKAFADPLRFALGGHLTDMDFLMGPVTHTLDPLDIPALRASPTRFVAVTTHAHTGEPCYLPAQGPDCVQALHATVAIPFFYRGGPIRFRHEDHFDGGVADPIPLAYAIDEKATDITVVLTRPASWQPPALSLLSRAYLTLHYADFPAIPKALANRHRVYARTRNLIANPPPDVSLRVIIPPDDFPVRRFTMDVPTLVRGYDMGYQAASP
jgi:predicted patatin/cPLA2 family phospholipase